MTVRRVAAAGFTLLETLVALALLGIVMSTVFGIIGGGLRSARQDEDRLLLGLVAQNLLERSRLDLSPLGGTRSGDIGGGLRWQIDSEPYEPPKDILPPARPGRESGDSSLSDGNKADDAASSTDSFGDSTGLGGEGGLSSSGLGGGSASDGDRSSGSQSGLGSSDRTSASGTESGLSTREQPAEKEKIKLRLVRVTVTKDDQRFELTGLAMEPRRKRTTSERSLSESRRDSTDQP